VPGLRSILPLQPFLFCLPCPPPGGYRPQYDTNRTIYVGQLRYGEHVHAAPSLSGREGEPARLAAPPPALASWQPFAFCLCVPPPPPLQLIYDKETGRSKGFGFVTFEDDRDARDALNDAGGRDLDGAAIKVNIAHGPAAMGFAGGRGRGRWGGSDAAPQPAAAACSRCDCGQCCAGLVRGDGPPALTAHAQCRCVATACCSYFSIVPRTSYWAALRGLSWYSQLHRRAICRAAG
jgi:hypothetical protein